ncbi:MAG TPA: DUF2080 family transposase-associated protein [Candidatus Nanoarchaeia archaeon]|nr:DUF2080 family transposase-associated protein [Candidatus Nanoarchaeia archaeon]
MAKRFKVGLKESVTPEDVQGCLASLERNLKGIVENMKKLGIPEEVIEKEIKPFGNASHIILPKEYENKKAKVIISR